MGALLIGVGYQFGVSGPPAPKAVDVVAGRADPAAAPAGAVAHGAVDSAYGATDLALGYSVPIRLTIQRLGIDTGLMTLGLNPDGTVEVPSDDPDAPAGWYRNLASPGEAGSAVLLGHVDSDGGPGVFYFLGASRAGDRVLVRRADGSTAAFTVERVASFPRDAFPTDEVYAEGGAPGLRLVTCGGEYDRDNGGYQENVVVFASLTETW